MESWLQAQTCRAPFQVYSVSHSIGPSARVPAVAGSTVLEQRGDTLVALG